MFSGNLIPPQTSNGILCNFIQISPRSFIKNGFVYLLHLFIFESESNEENIS